MPNAALLVSAPSRLHFGMFSFGVPTLRQFGGAGAMIDRPALVLRIAPSTHWEYVGGPIERIRQAVDSVRAADWGRDLSPVRIEVLFAPPAHTGLGTGTQTALTVVAGLRHFYHLPRLAAAELARAAGRAKRSAVGLYGFLHGGLIVEAGKWSHDVVAPLAALVELPQAWRFVLVRPRAQEGLSGDSERAAFAGLPSVPQALTDELCRIALLDLVPSARSGDFAGFAEALYRFGHAAGRCFKSHQAGVYATEQLATLVTRIRSAGVAGVGQSSWGPTLYTLHPTAEAAQEFVMSCERWADAPRYDVVLAAPNRGGATFQFEA